MPTPVAGDVLRFIRRYSDRPASEAQFNSLALRVFLFQFENNTFYRRFCEMEGVNPQNLKNWKRIPAMPASAFKELALTTFPVRKRKRVFKTSGTTAEKRGRHYFETLALYDASILPSFKKRVLKGGGFSFYFLMATDREAPDSSLSYMMGFVNRRLNKGKGRFYVKKKRPQYEALARDLKNERKKVLLLTTAFALKGFLEYLEEKNLRLQLKPESRLMETGGFKGRVREVSKAELYRMSRERLGVFDFVSEYGMTELSSQYYSANGGPFRSPSCMRAMAVDPKTGKECRKGQAGLLKHVDLANVGSVMAVQTEDLGRMIDGGFEVLGRTSGSESRGCSLSYERFLRSSH